MKLAITTVPIGSVVIMLQMVAVAVAPHHARLAIVVMMVVVALVGVLLDKRVTVIRAKMLMLVMQVVIALKTFMTHAELVLVLLRKDVLVL